MSKHDELKKWLRENSSGVYRQAAEAADVIEELENRVENFEELVSQLEEVIVFPAMDDRDWQFDRIKDILGLTNKKIFEKRLSREPEGRKA